MMQHPLSFHQLCSKLQDIYTVIFLPNPKRIRPSAMSRCLAHSFFQVMYDVSAVYPVTAGAGSSDLRYRRVASCCAGEVMQESGAVCTYATPPPGAVSCCFLEDWLYRRNEVIKHKPSETFLHHYWVKTVTSEHLYSSDEGEFIYVTESFLCPCRWAESVCIRFE